MTQIPFHKRDLSDKRIESVKMALIRSVKDESLARKLLKVRSMSQEDDGKHFVKFGVNLLLEKAFLVDGMPGDQTSYVYSGIGSSEGQSIAMGETNYLFEQIIGNPAITKIDEEGKLNEEKLINAISKMPENKSCKIIISNVFDISAFWYMREFKGIAKSTKMPQQNRRMEGYFRGIPVYWSNLSEAGSVLLVDNSLFGEMIVKREINVKITEISDLDKQEIIRANPTLSSVNFEQKVKLYADEVVLMEIKDPSAVLMLKVKSDGEISEGVH